MRRVRILTQEAAGEQRDQQQEKGRARHEWIVAHTASAVGLRSRAFFEKAWPLREALDRNEKRSSVLARRR
jgi:hypothetical protein